MTIAITILSRGAQREQTHHRPEYFRKSQLFTNLWSGLRFWRAQATDGSCTHTTAHLHTSRVPHGYVPKLQAGPEICENSFLHKYYAAAVFLLKLECSSQKDLWRHKKQGADGNEITKGIPQEPKSLEQVGKVGRVLPAFRKLKACLQSIRRSLE